MTPDFPTAPSAYGLNGPSADVTVEKSPYASHTDILTPPSGAEVIADMEEVQEIASVLAKPFFDLIGNPARAVSDGVQLAMATKACSACGVEENPSGLGRIAFKRAAIRQGLTASGMRQGDPGFLPAQMFALAPVSLGHIRVHHRNHATVHLGNDLFRPRRH